MQRTDRNILIRCLQSRYMYNHADKYKYLQQNQAALASSIPQERISTPLSVVLSPFLYLLSYGCFLRLWQWHPLKHSSHQAQAMWDRLYLMISMRHHRNGVESSE